MNFGLTDKMMCVTCKGRRIRLDTSTPDNAEDVVDGVLTCLDCGRTMPLRDGVIDNSPAEDGQQAIWEKLYKANAEDLRESIKELETGFSNPEALAAHYPIVRVMERFKDSISSSVELGCGSGAYSLILAKLGIVKDVTLLDYSLSSLKTAQGLFSYFGEKCNLVYGTLESAPFAESAFDLSLSGGVIEHYPSLPQRLDCLEAHLDVAKVAYVQAPVDAPFYWLQRYAYTAIRGGWPFGYERPLTTREFELLVRLADAEIIDIDYHYALSRLALMDPRLMSWQWFTKKIWFTRHTRTELAVLAARNSHGLAPVSQLC